MHYQVKRTQVYSDVVVQEKARSNVKTSLRIRRPDLTVARCCRSHFQMELLSWKRRGRGREKPNILWRWPPYSTSDCGQRIFRREVWRGSIRFSEAMPSRSELEQAKNLRYFATGIATEDFETLDSKVATGLMNILHGDTKMKRYWRLYLRQLDKSDQIKRLVALRFRNPNPRVTPNR